MQYKAGSDTSKLTLIIVNTIGISLILRISNTINSIKANNPTTNPKETINSPTKPIPVALTLLLPLIMNIGVPCSILSKVTSAFLLTSQINPIMVIQDKIMNLVIKAIEIPLNIPIKYTRFQKLSLFIREAIKPTFGWFGIFSSNCLTSFLSLKGFVKSCISVNSNHQFNILGIMLSGIRTLFKRITGTILFLSIFILGNTGAYATDITSSNGYRLKKYIASVEQKNRIPRGLLSAIVDVESDFNPYAVNIEGKSIIASNKSEAIKTIRNALNSGVTNIDIGIAQINYRWHKDNFKNIEEMINPATNIEYAAKLLSSLFKQHGTWHKAIRHYHSANPDHYKRYSRKVVIAWLGNGQLIK